MPQRYLRQGSCLETGVILSGAKDLGPRSNFQILRCAQNDRLPTRFYCIAPRTILKMVRIGNISRYDSALSDNFFMRRSTLHRLTTKIAALLAIAAVAIVQPMLSACTCGLLAAPREQVATREKVEVPPCCASRCSQEASEAAPSCCGSPSECDSTAGGAHHCDDCSCCTSADESSLAPQTTSSPTDDGSAPAVYLAALPGVLHSGLNGAAWHNAFDLASPGGPPGIRLHALLSVWRN